MSDYIVGKRIVINDRIQTGYRYELSENIGEVHSLDFSPHFSPQEMLALGIFEGKYCNDCTNEFPSEWFQDAKISDKAGPENNYFGTKSRQSLSEWQSKGWIYEPDPRGWFQWYCRYYLGRRLPQIDDIQKRRWRAFKRHVGQIRKNCEPGNIFCRPRQRQALLQWSHDAFI